MSSIIAGNLGEHTKVREQRIIRHFLRERVRELRGLRGLRRWWAKIVIYAWAQEQARPHLERLREEERHLLRHGAA